MKKPKYKLRLFFLYVFSFLASVLPVAVAFALKLPEYTKTVEETVKLSVGGVIIVALIIIKLIGKLKMPRRVVLFAMVFLLCYLLEGILKDLFLLSGLALLGEVIDFLIFQNAIKRTREAITISKTSSAVANETVAAIKSYIGRV